jgi:hypothetical protein
LRVDIWKNTGLGLRAWGQFKARSGRDSRELFILSGDEAVWYSGRRGHLLRKPRWCVAGPSNRQQRLCHTLDRGQHGKASATCPSGCRAGSPVERKRLGFSVFVSRLQALMLEHLAAPARCVYQVWSGWSVYQVWSGWSVYQVWSGWSVYQVWSGWSVMGWMDNLFDRAAFARSALEARQNAKGVIGGCRHDV